jgi:hypothetical protein
MRWGCRSALLAVALALALPGSAAGFGALGSFGEFGEGLGQLREPAQVAIAGNGDVYVADSGNHRISVFAGDGTFLRTLGEGVLQDPQDVALAGGVAFVADSGSERVDVFSEGGIHLFSYGAGELNEPTGLAVDGSTVFVADSGNSRIAVFEAGVLVEAIEAGLVSPHDAILGADGLLYVADHGNERVAVFDAGGEPAGTIGAGTLSGPVALAAGEGELLVADETAGRVERFEPNGAHLGGFAAEPSVAGVGAACEGNVFAVERMVGFARVERFGDPDTLAPPCLRPQPVVAPIVQPPSNRFRFNGLRLIRGNGMAILFVKVPDPGRLWLWGRGVRPLKRVARRATRVRLPVRPKVPLKRYLKRHGKGRVRVNVGFEPFGGDFRKREKPIVLRRHRRR